MNSALVVRYDAEDAELERERVGQDMASYWALVEAWLESATTSRVVVHLVDAHDACTCMYEVTKPAAPPA